MPARPRSRCAGNARRPRRRASSTRRTATSLQLQRDEFAGDRHLAVIVRRDRDRVWPAVKPSGSPARPRPAAAARRTRDRERFVRRRSRCAVRGPIARIRSSQRRDLRERLQQVVRSRRRIRAPSTARSTQSHRRVPAARPIRKGRPSASCSSTSSACASTCVERMRHPRCETNRNPCTRRTLADPSAARPATGR